MKIINLRIAPYLLLIGIGTYSLYNTCEEDIKELLKYDSKIETEVETETIEPAIEVIPLQEEIAEEVAEEIEEIVEETPVEELSDELVNSEYEFKEIDFDSYKEINPDVCGYIEINGTTIDFPVLYNGGKKDDEGIDFYLHHDMEGNKNSKGEIYLDNRDVTLEEPMYNLNDVNILYGHHLTYGRMFAPICNYKQQDFLDSHPFAVIYTPDGYAYKADIFGGILVKGTDSTIYHDNFESEEDFDEFIENIKENSYITSDVDLSYGDKLIAFVTCSYEDGLNGDLRYVVYAKLTKQYTNELQLEDNVENYIR